ncbi:MAG: hypothetical protein ACQ9IQ_03020 [Nitrospirales bacterium]
MFQKIAFKPLLNSKLLLAIFISVIASIIAGWLLVPALKNFPLEESLAVYYGKMRLATFWGLFGLMILLHLTIFTHRIHSDKNDFIALRISKIPATLRNALPLLFYAAFVLSGAFFLIAWPGNTILKIMTHDTFIFLDGAYRLANGQIPHIDFHTPLGYLTYLLPYFGLKISANFAGAMEMATFIAAIFMTLAAIQVLSTRYSSSSSIVSLVLLILIVVVPMNVGETPTNVTHAMFYNRFGWAAITILFLFFIEPVQKSKILSLTDVVAISGILLFLFYTKITYFVAGLAFIPIMAMGSHYNRLVAMKAFAAMCIGILSVELLFGFTIPYLHDIIMTIDSSGTIRKGLLKSLYKNNLQYLLVGLTSLIVFWFRGLRFSEYVYILFVAAMGIAIINQNAQHYGIPCLLAIILWAHETTRRETSKERKEVHRSAGLVPVKFVILVLLFIFVSQPIIKRVHGMSAYRIKKSQIEYAHVDALRGIRIGEKESLLGEVLNGDNRHELFFKLRDLNHKQPLTQGEYMETVVDGVKLLKNIETTNKSLMVIDLANPFTFIMSMKPPKGDYSFIHAGRNISTKNHIPAEELFQTVDYIMWPIFPMQKLTPELSETIYGDYIKKVYQISAQSDYWTLYAKKLT